MGIVILAGGQDRTVIVPVFESTSSFLGGPLLTIDSPIFQSNSDLIVPLVGIRLPIIPFESIAEFVSPRTAMTIKQINCVMTGLGSHETFNYIVGFGDQDYQYILQPILESHIFTIALQYGVSLNEVQVIWGELRGQFEGVQAKDIQSNYNSLLVNDPVFASQVINSRLVDELVRVQTLLLSVAEGVFDTQAILGILTEQELILCQSIMNDLSIYNDVGLQSMLQSLSDLEVQLYNFNTEIYIDGNRVSQLIAGDSVTISMGQQSIHNEISITSISQELFERGDPDINAGEPRVEVHVGTRVLFFLIEARNGSGADFTLWGRDQTARDSTPWATEKSVFLEAPELASSVAESVTDYAVVDWDAPDWVLPEAFESDGTPIEILQSIASELDLIIRAQDDGSLLIRNKYIVRPINLSAATVDLEYHANQVVDLSYSVVLGDHYNSVLIQSYTPDSPLPQIELEPLEDGRSRYRTTTSFVRVYWTDTNPEVQSSYVTDGNIVKLIGESANGTFFEEVEEIIEFKDGVGEVQYPIYDMDEITGIEWIGDAGNISSWQQYTKTINLVESEAFRIAKVTYRTEFTRYELFDHDVEVLLSVFFFSEFPLLNLLIMTAPIAKDINGDLMDKQGPKLQTSNINDESVAVIRGENWIDSNKYDYQSHSFTSPYRDNCQDGKIVWLDSKRIGSTGKYYITAANIIIEGAKVTNSIEVIQWQV